MHALLLQLASGDGHAPAFLNPHSWGLVFWTGTIFACVALLLYKMAWGPLLTALDEREQKISGAIDEAQSIKAEAEKTRQKYEDQMEKARAAAQEIIDEGEADKKRIIAEARTKAVSEADDIKARAERDITLAKTKAIAEVKDSATELGMAIASKVIQAEVDASKHKAVVGDVLDAFEKA